MRRACWHPTLSSRRPTGRSRGGEAVLLLFGTALDALRDVRLQYQIEFESPGVAVASFDARAVQERELLGLAPTGRERQVKGVAVFRLSGPAISEIRAIADTVHIGGGSAEPADVRPEGATPPPGDSEPGADTVTTHQIWLAGIGAVAAAEQYGARLFTALVERGKAWEPGAKATTARASETIGATAAAATAAVSGLGEKIRAAASTGEAAFTQFIKGQVAQPPGREEFEALKKQVNELAARLKDQEPRAKLTSRVKK